LEFYSDRCYQSAGVVESILAMEHPLIINSFRIDSIYSITTPDEYSRIFYAFDNIYGPPGKMELEDLVYLTADYCHIPLVFLPDTIETFSGKARFGSKDQTSINTFLRPDYDIRGILVKCFRLYQKF
jgi:hypothetical protein